jgi:hypothetical protein
MEETIKKEEAQNNENPTAQVPPVQLKHGVGKLIKEMWPAYLIEIFVIILGISITLGLEAWRESVKEDRLEQVYLKNLFSDVETDQGSLKTTIVKTEMLLDKGDELLAMIRTQQLKTLPSDKIKEDLRAILERPDFISRDASFSDLKTSGNLHLLKDVRLKNLLFAYYAETQHIRELQNAELQATIVLSGNYFLKLFSMDDKIVHEDAGSTNGLQALMNSAEFDNQVLLRVSNRKELLSVYKNTDSLGREVKEELKQKIE